MSGLSDMEELLTHIQNKDITDYMREALGCYSAGAYRACVVLSYIAVFDDLRRKLAQLASISSVAKDISKETEKRAMDQQIFESYMVDQLRSAGLITEIEAFRLEQIRVLRNKSAHPSGLHPSAEEARYVYFETIDKFLSKEVLKTTHGVDALLTRLKNDNYFPSQIVDEVSAIVSAETSAIHPLAFSYLVIKLAEACDSPEQTLSKNAAKFLFGLAVKDDPSINLELRNRLLVPKADDNTKHTLLLTTLSLNPRLLLELDGTTLLRLRSMMVAAVESEKLKPPTNVSHPAALLERMVGKLGAEYVESSFAKYVEIATTAFCYSGPIIRAASESSKIREVLVGLWKENAGSSDFATANRFADTAPQIDSLFPFLSPLDAFEIVLGVCGAANWNAFSAIGLRNQKFSSVPILRDLARQYATENPDDADEKALQVCSISGAEVVQKYLVSPD